ncbi:MAG TPA: SRPBCC domain-containing protein, partial [Caulobacteraceae bacterium]|nr:SRPBCC domain-containing protein [Caulobacteraceae bacterium]
MADGQRLRTLRRTRVPAQEHGDWDGIIDGEVLAVEPPKRLAYTWVSLGVETVVTFTLTATPSGARLRMEQVGFKPGQEA